MIVAALSAAAFLCPGHFLALNRPPRAYHAVSESRVLLCPRGLGVFFEILVRGKPRSLRIIRPTRVPNNEGKDQLAEIGNSHCLLTNCCRVGQAKRGPTSL